jgi:hypothetical protein
MRTEAQEAEGERETDNETPLCYPQITQISADF